jgi:hypothetical protein
MNKQTQGRRLIQALKRKSMTSMQLQMLGISTCWWKRVNESLASEEQLVKGKLYLGEGKFVNTYRVVSATKWSA